MNWMPLSWAPSSPLLIFERTDRIRKKSYYCPSTHVERLRCYKNSLHLQGHGGAIRRGAHIEAFLFSPLQRNRQFQNRRISITNVRLPYMQLMQYTGWAWVDCMFISVGVFGDTFCKINRQIPRFVVFINLPRPGI